MATPAASMTPNCFRVIKPTGLVLFLILRRMISIAHIFAPCLSFLTGAGSLVESATKTNKARSLPSSWAAVYLYFCEWHKLIDGDLWAKS